MNLTVALRLGQLLSERGASVVYTRTTDDHVYLSDRPAIANNARADLFISIHHNGSSDPNASGTCAICYPGSENGDQLATLCLNGLYNRLRLQQRGLIHRDDSDVTYTDMPAVISKAMFASTRLIVRCLITEVQSWKRWGSLTGSLLILDSLVCDHLRVVLFLFFQNILSHRLPHVEVVCQWCYDINRDTF